MTDTPTPAKTVAPSRPRRRKLLFVTLAVAFGLLPLLLLEIGLRLAGFGRDVAYQDPLVGFSRVAPLFELDEGRQVYETVRSRQVLFEKQTFAATKPENGFRIFCLGGSTVRGRPYTTQTAFPRWLQRELTARDPARTYEVINCGGLSYASYRLTHILQEVLTYDPDLIVIATGHNEFLEDRTYADVKNRTGLRSWFEDRLHQLRTVRVLRDWTTDVQATPSADDPRVLPELVEARLDEASGYASYHRDEAWAEAVLHHFEQSLCTMIDMGQTAGVPLVLVKLGSNVRDCPPFKSEHHTDLTVEQQRDWQSHVEAAGQQEADALDAALAEYQLALAIDDQHALLRFRIARFLDRLGRTDEAVPHYLAARELDVCPLRMRQSFAEVLDSVAGETHTPLLDAAGSIASRCDAGLAGNDWYMDHVHPTIESHQLIAAELVATIAGQSWSPQLADWSDDDRRTDRQDHWQSLGPNYLIHGFERVQWLENWARRQRLILDTLPRAASAHLRYGDRLWNFGRQDEAWEHYAMALEADPTLSQALLDRCDRLRSQGRTDEARQLQSRLAKP